VPRRSNHLYPQAKTSNRLPGLLRDRNGSLLASVLSPDRAPPGSIRHPPVRQQACTSDSRPSGFLESGAIFRQALRNLPILYREKLARNTQAPLSQLRIGICARASSQQRRVPDHTAVLRLAHNPFIYPRRPTELARSLLRR
jgi:hypothetical protein